MEEQETLVGEDMCFPDDFIWGSASSAYQIEGAFNEDGKGESIWDRFCHTSGKVASDDTGDIACDHYHRYPEDVELMATLGLQAYRFSISWTRVMPKGKGELNQPGLDFYKKLVDKLLDADIEPMIVLNAWDFPQALQENGGWANRDTVRYFQDYASVVYEALGDKVHLWVTHNEPWVIAFGGHYFGILAPGIQDLKTALQISHHLLLSHGMVVQTFRELADESINVGIILNLTPIHPATKNAEDQQAMKRIDGTMNRWFLDPLFQGAYPEDVLNLYGEMTPSIEAEDMEVISEEVDFLGVNYYTRLVVEAFPDDPLLNARPIPVEGSQYTESGWEVYPTGLHEVLMRLKDDYQPAALYITENGAAFPDLLDEKSQLKDLERVKFLRDHFREAYHSLKEGVPLRGYFVWSLMDIFEWDSGYSHGYGLIHVDRETLKRTVKESGLWYREFIRKQCVSREAI